MLFRNDNNLELILLLNILSNTDVVSTVSSPINTTLANESKTDQTRMNNATDDESANDVVDKNEEEDGQQQSYMTSTIKGTDVVGMSTISSLVEVSSSAPTNDSEVENGS